MASVVTNTFKRDLIGGAISLSSDICMAALVSSGFTTCSDIANVQSWQVLSAYEVSGTGYTAGGDEVTSLGVYVDTTNNRAIWSGDDLSWADSSISARGAALYFSATKNMIGINDFGVTKMSDNGSFIVRWSTSAGIAKQN